MARIALVIGGAVGAWEQCDEALALIAPHEYIVVACNHAGRDRPGRLDHWATMHPDLMLKWLQDRRRAGLPEPGQLWHARHRPTPIKSSVPIESWGGSSGMLCIRVAMEMGAKRIVLAGIPMDKMASHYDDSRPWMEARQYHPAWERQIPRLRGIVRSMSGWTMEKFGRPTREWIDA